MRMMQLKPVMDTTMTAIAFVLNFPAGAVQVVTVVTIVTTGVAMVVDEWEDEDRQQNVHSIVSW